MPKFDFAARRKQWERAKAGVADPKLAKKTFSKGLGPLLTELEDACVSIAKARSKSGWNPEKIVEHSAKVSALVAKAKPVAESYRKTCQQQQWNDAWTLARDIEHELDQRGQIEAAEWQPDAEYIKLWRYATLQMALTAAGLADARSADDLRKLLNQKAKDVNAARGNDAEVKRQFDPLARSLGTTDPKLHTASVLDRVKLSLQAKSPKDAALFRGSAQEQLDHFAKSTKRYADDVDKLKTLSATPEAKASSLKGTIADTLKRAEANRKALADAYAACAQAVAKLPKTAG